MALVAYEYSDSSDIEEEETDVTRKEEDKIVLETQYQIEVVPAISTSSNTGDNLFNFLPKPTKSKVAIEEDDDEFLHKKETISKPKAKITVPSLSDFKDVEGTIPNTRPKVTNGKKSGLLSLLPQPKHAVSVFTTTKSFVPHILTKKPASAPAVEKNQQLISSVKKNKHDLKSLAKDYSDDSEDDEIQNDFFSINKTIEPVPDLHILPNTQDKSQEVTIETDTVSRESQIHNIQSYFKKDAFEELSSTSHAGDSSNHVSCEGDSSSYGSDNQGQTSNSNEVLLDDEAILKLCGARSKRKREEIQIVDVNQQEVLADAREWLLKGLMDDTTKRVSVSKRRGDEPTSQQRRKHQITYLAHQAKANEAELQNQWANNRMSKRQTQSKYGF